MLTLESPHYTALHHTPLCGDMLTFKSPGYTTLNQSLENPQACKFELTERSGTPLHVNVLTHKSCKYTTLHYTVIC